MEISEDELKRRAEDWNKAGKIILEDFREAITRKDNFGFDKLEQFAYDCGGDCWRNSGEDFLKRCWERYEKEIEIRYYNSWIKKDSEEKP